MLNPDYVIFPNGGQGKRFQNDNNSIPKPFIEVFGRTQIEWAVLSASINYPKSKFVFGFRTDLVKEYKILLSNLFNEINKNSKLIDIGYKTNGAAETVAKILEKNLLFVSDFSFVVVDNDVFAIVKSYNDYTNSDCHLLFTQSSNPSHSFITFDKNNKVDEIVEKKMISEWGVVGQYYFKSAVNFLNYYEQIKNQKSEIYISRIINKYITERKIVTATEVEFVTSFGTPTEINKLDSRIKKILGKYVG
jgi:NDP-sugar pyrophosphorylase family protein